jgi:PPK2 family polyphosphate:nucleotide phosphotransferase
VKNDKAAHKAAARLSQPYRVTDGRRFRLSAVDPRDTGGIEDRESAEAMLEAGIELLSDLQEKLYAQNRWSVLLIFQAMDAAGKDGTIEHVMSGVNPQGVDVRSFKAPTHHELDHDFLWRGVVALPERGRIGIHNRSWYEEVLVVRVHPEILASQPIPPGLVTKNVWKERFRDFRAFERYLAANGTAIVKFFLHVSKAEQKRRFLARLDEPAKNWKFSSGDVEERKHWKGYMHAYEDAVRETAADHAPWYVVPADHKWYTRLVVAAAIVDTLARLDLAFPKVSAAQRKELAAARRALMAERG